MEGKLGNKERDVDKCDQDRERTGNKIETR